MADTNFEFLTYSELCEYLDDASLSLMQEAQYETLPKLNQIKVLGNFLNNYFSDIDKQGDKKIYELGMRFVFQLRSFLLNEEIIFSIGATSPKGELSIREVHQSELFQHIHVNLEKQSVRINEELERFDKNYIDQVQSKYWQQIVDAASFDWDGDEKYTSKFLATSSKRKRKIYKKSSPDVNVWVRYYMTRTKALMIVKYYNKGGDNFMNFNEGWLYEWFLDYIYSKQDGMQTLAESLKTETPLRPIMEGANRENIAGYKGGDIQTLTGKQIQAKKGNNKIITFNSIKKVISETLSIIDIYEKHIMDPGAAQILGEKFAQLFTHESILKNTNKDMNNIVDDIIKVLKI